MNTEEALEIRTLCEVVVWLHRSYQLVGDQRSEAMTRTRRNHGATCKAQVALAAIKDDKTLTELAERFCVHLAQITDWKRHLLARVADVFGGATPTADTPDLNTLHAKIGQLALENDG